MSTKMKIFCNFHEIDLKKVDKLEKHVFLIDFFMVSPLLISQ